jgi:hypothetical protein
MDLPRYQQLPGLIARTTPAEAAELVEMVDREKRVSFWFGFGAGLVAGALAAAAGLVLIALLATA